MERRHKARLVKELLGILGILILLIEIYRFVRRYWLRRLLEKKKKEKRTRKPAVLRLISEHGKLPRLPVLTRGSEEMDSSRVRNARILTVTERAGRTEEKGSEGDIGSQASI